MQKNVRAILRQTRVRTASGVMIGWVFDVKLDLYQGKVVQIAVTSSRYWRFSPIWILREQIVCWDESVITVIDAWAEKKWTIPVKKNVPAAASCYAERSSK